MMMKASINKEVRSLATKSFLKNVSIRDTKQAQSFIRALEHSSTCIQKPVRYSKTVSEMSREQMQKVFGDKHSDGDADRV